MDRARRTDLATRYWLAAAIPAVLVLSALLPEAALSLPGLHLTDAGVVLVVFLGSLKLGADRFRRAWRRIDLVVLSLVAAFALAPLASLALARVLGLGSPEDSLAVLVCAANGSTLATAVVLTEVAGGDTALAMVMTVVNTLLSVVLTPLVFLVLGGAVVDIDAPSMIADMACKIVLPLLAAQVARRWLAKWAALHARKLSVASQIVILSYIWTGGAAGLAAMAGRGGVLLARVVALVLVLHAGLLVVNAIVARLAARDPGQRVAFVLCSSQKTLPVAMMLWKGYFPALPLGPLVAVAYHVTQLVVDSILAPGALRLPLVRSKEERR
ncbi:MAG: bile acid:sodium symporter [Deltaproteobacteria bacterium]|nr:bile acid:sodium symporter [Deltaproteobacteria bacterium]